MSLQSKIVEISHLEGKFIESIEISDDKRVIEIIDGEGQKYQMLHFQDLMEDVYVSDVTGDLSDVIGGRIIKAEKRSSENRPDELTWQSWTFYELATRDAHITIRWNGVSTGDYSRDVDLIKIKGGEDYKGSGILSRVGLNESKDQNS